MTDLFFVILYLALPAFVILILKYAKINLLRFSIPSFIMSCMFVYTYMGTLPLYFAWDEYRYHGNGVQDKNIILQVFFATSFTILTMALGMACSRKLLGSSNSIILSSSIRKLSKRERGFLVVFIFVCVFVLCVYLSKIPSIALLTTIYKGIDAGKVARSEMSNNFVEKYHWYKVFVIDGLFLATFVTFANSLVTRLTSKKIFFYVVFVVTAFSALSATEKAPFLELIIGLFLVVTLIKNEGFYSWKILSKFGIVALIILVSMYIKFMGSNNITSALGSIASRLFTGGIVPAYWYIEIFPKYQDFLGGRTFPNPAGILPFEPYRLTVEVMNFKYPELAIKGIVGSAPTVFWGELYVNFGWLGLSTIPFLVGFLLYTFSILVNKLEDTPLKVGLTVFIALHYSHLALTSLSRFIIDFYLIIILFIFLVISISSNQGRLRIKK
jgi:hypothetical protein